MLPKKFFQEGGSVPLIILVASLGVVAFLIISNTFNFKDTLFSNLFPKPASHAATITKPVQLAAFFGWPTDPNTKLQWSTNDVVTKIKQIISEPDDKRWNEIKSKGYTNPFFEYILFDYVEGPLGFEGANPETTVCNSTQQSWVSTRVNSVIRTGIDYCQIQDSIVESQKVSPDPSKKVDINADGNPAGSDSDDVFATKDWFLHKTDGTRYTDPNKTTTSMSYYVNPGKQEWRDYFKARVMKDLNAKIGDRINPNYTYQVKVDGVFLDNVTVQGWGNLHAQPQEYSSQTEFHTAIVSFIQQVHDLVKGYNVPLWANMIAGNDTPGEWDSFAPYLEGAFKENYVLNWGVGPYDINRQLNQMDQAEKWITQQGKSYVFIGWGSPTNLDNDMRYSLAASLLVTDGVHGYYKFHGSSDGGYYWFRDYPEYYYQLGGPLGAKTQKSSSPLVYQRDFQCGHVELDMTNKVGTISYTPGCIPGTNPASTPSPTSTSFPSPTLSPTSSTNLIINSGCEANTSGWGYGNATLTQNTLVGYLSVASCQVAYLGSGAYYTLDDSPDSVLFSSSNLPTAGTQYTATAWVRSDNAIGKTINLIIRQRGGTTLNTSNVQTSTTLSSTWQKLTTTSIVDASDRSLLDVYISRESSLSPNEAFQADDICLAKGSSCSITITPTPTLIPTPTPTVIPTPTPLPTVAPAGGTGDIAVPTVSITSPANGSTLTGLVTINATATDTGGYGNTGTGISKVDFYLDNVLLSTVTNPAPLAGTPFTASTIWDTTNLTQGLPHTIFAKAYDNATPAINISSPSASISITIADITSPTITLTKPIFGETVSGLVDISADASDNVGVTKVEFYVEGSSVFVSSTPPYTYSWDSTGVINGSHSLNVKAFDAVGNTSSAVVTVNVLNRETIPPSAPTNLTASAFSSSQVNLSWTASTDNVGVTGYFVIRDGQTIGTVSTNSYQDISNPSANYFVTENTSYTYQIIAFDAAGNYSLASDPASVTTPLSPDIQAPTVPTNVTAIAFSSSQINLKWTASTDNRTGAIKYDVYRGTTLLAKEITDTSYGDTGLTASTPYSYFVKAKDAAGNTSDSSKTVSATTQAPPVTTGNISGTVKSQSGVNISLAMVSVTESGGTNTTTTNPIGSYSLLNVSAGSPLVTYSATSYATQTINVLVTAGATTIQNVTLTPVNLVKNSGCENVTNNWVGYHATLSTTTTLPKSGVASCLLTFTSGNYYSIDDNPSTVINPSVGRTYTAFAYVRSSNPISKPVIITLRQRGGSQGPKNKDSAVYNLNSSWQKVSVSTTIDTGRTELEVYIHQDKAGKGDSFQVDDINLNLQ